MRYLYYPGCSLESSSIAYDESLRWVFKALGIDLIELEDWNCCGATVYMSVKEVVSVVISARNLALAEKMNGDIIAPCNACYTTLCKANRLLKSNKILKAKVDQALKIDNLQYNLGVNVRHPLDVFVNDIGLDVIASRQKRQLSGLKIAPYYGCQIVRPEPGFDDQENPTTMDSLFEKLGAESVYYPMKVRCCGGMLMTTYENAALKLNKEILECAVENNADCIVTTCPLCQINLEAYQNRINKKFETDIHIPVLFFTQLVGQALGGNLKELGLHRHIVPIGEKVAELMEI